MSLHGRLSMFKRPSAQPNSIGSPGFKPESSSRLKANTTQSLRSRLTVYRDDIFNAPRPSPSQNEPQPDRNVRPSKLVVAFVNSLTAGQLSDFLVWFFYYDVVKLPDSPAIWYKAINTTEMRGWISLGQFFSKTTKYGLDLVVLDSICDRLRFSKTLVCECLVRLADPSTMSSTLLSTIIQKASKPEHTEIDVLEIVRFELNEIRRLLSRLTPSNKSIFLEWQPQIAKQLKDFVDVVISCRLATLRKQPPVLSGLTIEQERRLKYVFEAMQEERHVPLIRYGIVPDPPMQLTLSTSSDSLDGELPAIDDDVLEHQEEAECLYTPQQLQTELRVVRTQNMQLSKENSSLIKVNEQLAKKVLLLSRTKMELESKNIELHSVTVTTATPGGLASPAPVRQVHSKSSHRLSPTPLSMFKHMTALGEKDKNVFSHHRFGSDSPSKLEINFFSSPLSQSPENNDVFKAIDDKPLPLLLIDPTTQDTVKLPRNVGSNNLKQKASGILPDGDRLVRNNGIVDLQTAAVLEYHQPPTVAKVISQRSASDKD